MSKPTHTPGPWRVGAYGTTVMTGRPNSQANDSITWTGTPDDQRAEWRGMKAYAVWCGPQEWEATVYRGSVKGERLLATLPGRPPRSVQEAKWLCELVMRHEAADSGLTGDHGLISRTARVTLPARGGGEVTAPPSPRRAAS